MDPSPAQPPKPEPHLGEHSSARIRRGERLVARALFCFIAAIYLLAATGLPDHNDSETEFQTTSALGRGATFALGGTPESDALVQFRKDQPDNPSIPVKLSEDGERGYSWFGTGQALVGVPFYWLGKAVALVAPGVEAGFAERRIQGVVPRSEYYAHLFVGLRNPLLGAATAWLVVLCALRLGLTRRTAFLAGATYGLCTFALPQARSTLSDVQAAFCLFGAFYLILTVREHLERARQPAARHLVAAGGLLGLAFLTRVLTAPAIAVLVAAMVAVLLVGHRRSPAGGERPDPKAPLRDLALFCGPAAMGLGLFLAFNLARFGDAMETGYGDVVGASFFSFNPWVGLLLVCFAPGKGLAFLAPGLALAPLGWRRAEGGAGRFFGWVTFGVTLAVFTPVVMTETWHGAWTFGPRYVLPALPFLWLGTAVAIESLGRKGRLAAWALMFVGGAAALGGTLTDHMTHQDLAVQAARLDWPDLPAGDDQRFGLIQVEPRYAAPWAHWRILRHRAAGLGEVFSSSELFYTEKDEPLRPNPEARPGMGHLAWVDHARLGGATWPVLLAALALSVLGLRLLAAARLH